MWLVLLEFNDGASPEIYGPFETEEKALFWGGTIHKYNERVLRTTVERPLTPCPVSELIRVD